jgi:hypothetical protein
VYYSYASYITYLDTYWMLKMLYDNVNMYDYDVVCVHVCLCMFECVVCTSV